MKTFTIISIIFLLANIACLGFMLGKMSHRIAVLEYFMDTGVNLYKK